MSINLENPKTTLEKADAAANFVAQMYLAHGMKDEATFKKAYDRASTLLSDVIDELDT